ncbi:hypothetical protein DXG01_001894 [Tephrocybe rancida]|nr:hypothetical protein DXG01_001894 [Tephrocybe rancida]
MKLLSLASLFIIAISLILPSSAAPTRRTLSDEEKIAAYIKNAANKASIDPPCFYSGFTEIQRPGENVSHKTYAWTKLEVWQKTHGINCHTISEIVDKAAPGLKPSKEFNWGVVSKAFAETVSGPVYVLLGSEVPMAVWKKEERPALKANGKVTAVEVWELRKDGEIIRTTKTKATM